MNFRVFVSPKWMNSLLLLGAGFSLLCSTGFASESQDKGPGYQQGLAHRQTQGHWLTHWDHADRVTWYTKTQGSHLVRYDVFMSIIDAKSSEPFHKVLRRYGFATGVVKSDADYTFDGLPFGLVPDQNQLNDRVFLGLNCAACHTGEVTHQGKRYLIDAGQSMVDLPGFIEGLNDALQATFNNSKKRHAYYAAMKTVAEDTALKSFGKRGSGKVEALAKLSKARREFASFTEKFLPPEGFETGPGRLDAVSEILNALLGDHLGDSSNRRPNTVPVSYPAVWDAPKLECVQTNCLSKNPLTRNIGEVLGVFGQVRLSKLDLARDLARNFFEERVGNPDIWQETRAFRNTVKVENLVEMEDTLKRMTSPSWPENVLGPLDGKLVAEGRKIYQEGCQSCHAILEKDDQGAYILNDENLTPPNTKGVRKFIVTTHNYKEIGTDARFMEVHGSRTANPGILAKVGQRVIAGMRESGNRVPDALLPLEEEGVKEVPGLSLLGLVTGVIKERHYKMHKIGPERQAEMEAHSDPSTDFIATNYRARPLNGVAFSAPYLHGGSVPNLWQLLTSPSKRLKSFQLGSLVYDPIQVGYETKGSFTFDATRSGNTAVGHDYGTDLTEKQKWALIEFLKSL